MSLTKNPQDGAKLPSWSGKDRDVRDLIARPEGLTAEDAVVLACTDLVRRWPAGGLVPAEADFALHPAPVAEGEGAFELAYSEFALREELGESPSLGEFARRFPGHAERCRIQVAMCRAIEANTDRVAQADGAVPMVNGGGSSPRRNSRLRPSGRRSGVSRSNRRSGGAG